MGYKLNIRDADTWKNLLEAQYSPIADSGNKFTATNVETALSELFDNKAPYTVKTVAPTVNDDLPSGFPAGTIWTNTTSDYSYISVDSTDDAAIWMRINFSENEIKAMVGTMVSGNTETNITVTYDAIGKKLNFVVNPAGSDTYVQINDGGVLGADAGLKYNKSTQTLSVSGDFLLGGSVDVGGLINTKINKHETVATASQTVFDLPWTFASGQIGIYIDGVRQMSNSYAETDNNTITFSVGLEEGNQLLFVAVEDSVYTAVNATTINGIRIYSDSSEPGLVSPNDLWFEIV